MNFLEWLYNATWLWLLWFILFLTQTLRCSPRAKLVLFKIGQYYIVLVIALQLLVPVSHLVLRTLLFDLSTRMFLFIQAAELLWTAWNSHDEQDEETPLRQLIGYAISALLYLGWAVLGVIFAFKLV
jgi:hypothetical protein